MCVVDFNFFDQSPVVPEFQILKHWVHDAFETIIIVMTIERSFTDDRRDIPRPHFTWFYFWKCGSCTYYYSQM